MTGAQMVRSRSTMYELFKIQNTTSQLPLFHGFRSLWKTIIILMRLSMASYLARYTFELFLGPPWWNECVKFIGLLIPHGCDVLLTNESVLHTDLIIAARGTIRKCPRCVAGNLARHSTKLEMIYQQDRFCVIWYRQRIQTQLRIQIQIQMQIQTRYCIFRDQTISVRHILLHDWTVTVLYSMLTSLLPQ